MNMVGQCKWKLTGFGHKKDKKTSAGIAKHMILTATSCADQETRKKTDVTERIC